MRIFLTLILFSFSISAQPNPQYFPTRINESIQLDGKLNETVWQNAEKINSFVQREPRDGVTPSEKTEVQIVFDERNIYLGIRCYDSEPSKILYRTMDRDNFDIVLDDQFVFVLDTYNDERNGYWFSTNPAGAKVDAQFIDEGNIFNSNWDGKWYVKTGIDDLGWTIEVQLPLFTIRYKESDDVVMGLNLFRRVVRKNEVMFSPPIPREFLNGSSTVSRARKLHFGELKEVNSFYILPYVLGGVRNEQFTAKSETTFQKDAGLDLKYSITSNLTADFTVNTDFAQAEIDNQQINFSRSQLFYPEKREFFLENSGYFDFGLQNYMQPFFSRRIGIENNQVVPIIAGARLSGKVDDWGIGVLNIQTAKKHSIQSTNYSVARVTKEIFNRSYVGGFFTNKQVNSNRFNRVAGADVNFAVGDNNILSAFLSKSFTDGDAGNGLLWNLRAYRVSEIFSFNAAYTNVDADYNPEVGFIARSGIQDLTTEISYSHFIESFGIRKIVFEPYNEYITDRNSSLLTRTTKLTLRNVFETEDEIYVAVLNEHENVKNPLQFLTEFEVAAGNYNFNEYGFGVQTNGYRVVSGSIDVILGDFYDTQIRDYRIGASLKISNQLNTGANFRLTEFKRGNNKFDVTLYDANVKFTFNTEMFASLFVQYNTEDKIFQTNFRFEWEMLTGSKFYFVATSNKIDPISKRVIGDKAEVLLKYVHQINL